MFTRIKQNDTCTILTYFCMCSRSHSFWFASNFISVTVCICRIYLISPYSYFSLRQCKLIWIKNNFIIRPIWLYFACVSFDWLIVWDFFKNSAVFIYLSLMCWMWIVVVLSLTILFKQVCRHCFDFNHLAFYPWS